MLALATTGIGLKRALRHQLHLHSVCPTGPRKIVVAKSSGFLRVSAQYRRRAFLHVNRPIRKQSPHLRSALDEAGLTAPNMSRLRSRMRTRSVHFPPEARSRMAARPSEQRRCPHLWIKLLTGGASLELTGPRAARWLLGGPMTGGRGSGLGLWKTWPRARASRRSFRLHKGE